MKNGFGNEGSFIMRSSAQRKKTNAKENQVRKRERENTCVTYILHAYLRKAKNMQDML